MAAAKMGDGGDIHCRFATHVSGKIWQNWPGNFSHSVKIEAWRGHLRSRKTGSMEPSAAVWRAHQALTVANAAMPRSGVPSMSA